MPSMERPAAHGREPLESPGAAPAPAEPQPAGVPAGGGKPWVLGDAGVSLGQRQALARLVGAERSNQDLQRLAGRAARVTIARSPLSEELAGVWAQPDHAGFFQRLRHLNESDDALATWVEQKLRGDDRWLARNLIQHGAEPGWPIHLRVEREMKGWRDSGGKGAVFEILRAANAGEASNSELSATLERVFAAGSDDLWLAQQLQRIGPEPGWPPAEQQVLAERQLAWDLVRDLRAAAGFQALSPEEQNRVVVYAGGHTSLSEGGAAAIQAVLNDPAKAADPEAFRQALSQQAGRAELGQLRESLPNVVQVTVDPPVTVSAHPFSSGPANALRHVVHIDDAATASAFNANTIEILEPETAPAGGGLPNVADVVAMIRRLPRASRATIVRFDLNPAANPLDPYWEATYGIPGFVSDMTAGADGVVNVYPLPSRTTQGMTETTLHESGHAVSERAWGGGPQLPDGSPNPQWDPWRHAMATDNFVVSNYATASPSEDFGEAWLMFMQYRGTPREAEIRTLMPARCQLLDQLIAAEGTG